MTSYSRTIPKPSRGALLCGAVILFCAVASPAQAQVASCVVPSADEPGLVTIWTPSQLSKLNETRDDLLQDRLDTEAETERLLDIFPIDTTFWHHGWGAEDLPSVDPNKHLGRLLSAFALLDRGTEHPTQEEIAFWAGHLVQTEAFPFAPYCDIDPGQNAAAWPVTVTFETGPSFTPFTHFGWTTANWKVWDRAALAVHETRHAQGMFHLITWFGEQRKCPETGIRPLEGCCLFTNKSCDDTFWDFGPNAIQAAYLASLARTEALRSDPLFSADNQREMVRKANSFLQGYFRKDPGFYIEDQLDPDFGLTDATAGSFAVSGTTVANGGPFGGESPMTQLDTTLCYLTKAAGAFGSREEFIEIDPDVANDRWVLRAGSHFQDSHAAIEGRARCVTSGVPGQGIVVDETVVDQLDDQGVPQVAVTQVLGPAAGRACFLMGIRGALTDSQQGAWATIESDPQLGDQWIAHLLSSHATIDTQRLSAKFGCVDAQTVHTGDLATGGSPMVGLPWALWPSDAQIGDPTDPSSTGSTYMVDAIACALSGVRGQFAGYAEFVEITPHYEEVVTIDSNGRARIDLVDVTYPTTWGMNLGDNRFLHGVIMNTSCFLRPGLVGR